MLLFILVSDITCDLYLTSYLKRTSLISHVRKPPVTNSYPTGQCGFQTLVVF